MVSPAHARSDEGSARSVFVLPRMSHRALPDETLQQRCANKLSEQRLRMIALTGERKTQVCGLCPMEAALATNRFVHARHDDSEQSSIDG